MLTKESALSSMVSLAQNAPVFARIFFFFIFMGFGSMRFILLDIFFTPMTLIILKVLRRVALKFVFPFLFAPCACAVSVL